MTLLLEINDLNVRCFQGEQLLAESPGIAVVEKKNLYLGSEAMEISRRNPLQTHTNFWSQLNTQPLQTPSNTIRHNGDLAYRHLQHLERKLDVSFAGHEVIFSIPGNTPKESLSLLLGIAQQLKLTPLGIVDTALASLLPCISSERAWHLEMHLHQSVISELVLEKGELQCRQTEHLPDQGWLSLHNQLLSLFTDAFIEQTRFNPRHGADTEQALFNAIPSWLQHIENGAEQTFEIDGRSIKLKTSAIQQQVNQFFQPLQQKIKPLQPLFLGDRVENIQSILGLSHAHQIQMQNLCNSYHQLSHNLNTHPQGIRFINALPCNRTIEPTSDVPKATHILYHHRAYPLTKDYGISKEGKLITLTDEHQLAHISKGELNAGPSPELQLNGQPFSGTHQLIQGDKLTLTNSKPLRLITVVDR